MRLALLVLALREPEVLRAALPLYKQAGFDVFVHLDRKGDLNTYLHRLGTAAAGCQIIDRRVDIFWGGFSMVEAQLALILSAWDGGDYDRFVLVSDDTFPVVRPERIRRVISEEIDRVMIRKLAHDDPFMRRYNNFYFFDHQASSLLGRPIETAGIDDVFLANMARLRDVKSKGKKLVDIYYGSQWWSITRQSMGSILKCLEDDQHLADSFRFSAVPDEILFQTLVGNYVPRSRVRSGPVYVEWSRNPKPYIFTNADELATIGEEYMFARKFSSRIPAAYQELLKRLS